MNASGYYLFHLTLIFSKGALDLKNNLGPVLCNFYGQTLEEILFLKELSQYLHVLAVITLSVAQIELNLEKPILLFYASV